MEYLFGDTDLAAERLEVLARIFAEPSRPFVRECAPERGALAVDLGCGPGHTTHMLAGLVACEAVVGLDNSEHFISLARATATERISFALHDVTVTPFPIGPADTLYCRFLLTHQADPAAIVGRWVTQLRPGGRLLMEEVEWIRTDNAVFTSYLAIVAAMLADEDRELYVGPVLDALAPADGLARRSSAVARLAVTARDAATMFFMNMQFWKSNTFVQANWPQAELERLEQQLRKLAEGASGAGVDWGLRQIACERV